MPPANRQKTLIEWTPRDLATVDAAAEEANLSRSEFIRRACLKQAAAKGKATKP